VVTTDGHGAVLEDAVDIPTVGSVTCTARRQGVAYAHTRRLGYHPLPAIRADAGEILIRPAPKAGGSR
jgi:hypothetical protein